jgi:16S rRNA (guanine527-N7)-methyltransferase
LVADFRPIATLTDDENRKLDIYRALLIKWQRHLNLVSDRSIGDLWKRHFIDSLQIIPLAKKWRNWVDIGSGGGFPGMVVGLLSGNDDGCQVHLIESDKRKAAFLMEVSRETCSRVTIHADRIEKVLPALSSTIKFDVISARALAPMNTLLQYAKPIIENNGVGLFLKGKELHIELTELDRRYSLKIELKDSVTESGARIVIVRSLNS